MKRPRFTKLTFHGLNRAIIFFTTIFLIGVALREFVIQGSILIPAIAFTLLEFFLFLIITYLLASIVSRISVNSFLKLFPEFDPEEKILVSKLYVAAIYIFATTAVLWRAGVTASNITIFLGLATTGIAFAIRDIFLSYIAWFILLTKRPFRLGDHISIDGYEGKVQHIGTFYVIVDDSPQSYEDFVKVPNKLFLEKPVRNYGKGSFQSSFALKLNTYPKDYDKRIDRFMSKAEGVINRPALSATKEGIFVTCMFASDYDNRSRVQDALLKLLVTELPVFKEP